MSFPAAIGDADYGTLNERAWPTFAQIDETLRGLRCEWLRPYRTTRRIPLQRTGAERVTVKWLPARLRALEARYPNRPRIVRQRVWTEAEQETALRYRLNKQAMLLATHQNERAKAVHYQLCGLIMNARVPRKRQWERRQAILLRARMALLWQP